MTVNSVWARLLRPRSNETQSAAEPLESEQAIRPIRLNASDAGHGIRMLRPTVAFLVLVLSLLRPNPAAAEALPAGSFQQTCRNMSADGGTLRGQCRTRSGNWPGTELQNFRQCVGDINNQDGQLHCNRGAAPPGGSYLQSCRDVWMDFGTLHASCLNRAHAWIPSQLADVAHCRSEINNQEGVLRCDKGAPAPGGSYRQSCRDIAFDSGTLRASCQNRAGGWVPTSLTEAFQCHGDISNFDGQLRCNRGVETPRGSYQQTCRDMWAEGTTLHASCSNGSGGWTPSTLTTFPSCVGDIFNFAGTLACNRTALPDGSFRQSCSDIWIDGDTLRAHCRTSGGGSIPAQLPRLSTCVPGSIVNRAGGLDCMHGNRPPPDGSYRQSCGNIWMQDNMLSADCGSTHSNLDIRGCTGDIANIHGLLTCPKGNGPAPPGSYQKSCVDIFVAGTVLTARCETISKQWAAPTRLPNYPSCGGAIENINGKLSCGSIVRPPTPSPSDSGYKTLQVSNCNTDLDESGQHRSISVWMLDTFFTTRGLPSEGFRRGTPPMKGQYSSTGQCPFDENGQPIDPDSIDLIGHNALNNLHVFKVVIVDPGMPACEGRDDPTLDNCIRMQFLIKANKNGDSFKYQAE